MAKWPYTTQRWQRLRRAKLREYPLCEACLQLGLVVPASVVDHRKRIVTGGPPFPPLEGLASLCAQCHNQKSRAEQRGEENYLAKGCDARGYPLDRNHPWYKS
jgi:5-methylcytosine-specific restriction endonuclease McrA